MHEARGRTLWLSAGLALLLAAWLVATPAARPQEPKPAPPSEQKQGPIQPKQRPQEEEPYTLRVEAPLVTVDVVVTDRNGNFLPNLQKENFRLYEDGIEQTVTNFSPSESPITAVLVLETTPRIWRAYYDSLDAAYLFLRRMRPDDWVALVTFDMRPQVAVDFTRNKQEVQEYLRRLEFMSGFREANAFDAILDVLDRLRDVEGKRSILFIGSGLNTFSQNSWDQTIRRVREAESGVSIYALGMGWWLQMYADMYDMTTARMDLQLAEGQLKELAKQTGGRAYFPRFTGELPGIWEEIAAMLRNQYTIAYQPKNFKRDGKYHKIKVELVAPDGSPLKVVDEKGKPLKMNISHRQGYIAPKEGEVAALP